MPTSPAIDHARLLEIRANTRYSGLRTAIYTFRWLSIVTCGAVFLMFIKDLLPMMRHLGGMGISNLVLFTAPIQGALGAYVLTGVLEALLDRVDSALATEQRDEA